MTEFNQLVVGAAPGDAITQMACVIRDGLRSHGPSEIYARHRDPALEDDVLAMDDLPAGRPGDVLVYHASYGDPEITRVLLRRPERLVLVYHNITPSEYFIDIDPAFAAGLEWGRHELSLLCDRTWLNVADSEFNAADLRARGYRGVTVIPAGVEVDRLVTPDPHPDVVRDLRMRCGDRYVIGVSQVLPHKRQDVLVQAVHLLQTTLGIDVGLLLVGPLPSARYHRALEELIRSLRVEHAWIAGRQSDRALATMMRDAAVFASASAHEGLGIPPLEAMAVAVPTIVRDAGATAETVGDGALVLPNDAGPAMFAEAIARVLDDDELRLGLVSAGLARCNELAERARRSNELVELISAELVGS